MNYKVSFFVFIVDIVNLARTLRRVDKALFEGYIGLKVNLGPR